VQKHKKKPSFRSAYYAPPDDLVSENLNKPKAPNIESLKRRPTPLPRDSAEGQRRKALIDTLLQLTEESVQSVVKQWDETVSDVRSHYQAY